MRRKARAGPFGRQNGGNRVFTKSIEPKRLATDLKLPMVPRA
jgi:hypothetical protein